MLTCVVESDRDLSKESARPQSGENLLVLVLSAYESNRELEKFGKPQLSHSHTQDELARASYI